MNLSITVAELLPWRCGFLEGMVDTSVSPAMGYMEIVARRDAATLLPIIQAS